ncbi:hypothetical protein ACJJTC_009520 [Scirpophaga incertulas]
MTADSVRDQRLMMCKHPHGRFAILPRDYTAMFAFSMCEKKHVSSFPFVNKMISKNTSEPTPHTQRWRAGDIKARRKLPISGARCFCGNTDALRTDPNVASTVSITRECFKLTL